MTPAALSWFETVVFFALGLSFHVLATPEVAGISLRLSLSDLVLATALPLVAWPFLTSASRAQLVGLRKSYLWLLAMFALLLLAYVRTGVYSDSPAVWARFRLIGFVVLAGYFVAGTLISTSRGERGALLVARGFIVGAWSSAALGLIEYGAYFYFDYPITWGARIAALAQNPNAYGIMLAAALALDLGIATRTPWASERWRLAGNSALVVAVFLSASRSSYIGLFAGIAGLLLFTEVRLRRVATLAVSGLLLFVVLFQIPPLLPGPSDIAGLLGGATDTAAPAAGGRAARPSSPLVPTPRPETFAVAREQVDIGFNVRVDLLREATAMWWQRPLLGAGLGAFWRAQQARQVPFPYVNHNTALWLASETGAVGLALFFGGLLAAGAAFVAQSKRLALAAGVVGVLCVMLGASVGTEVSYQRYGWCLAGLAVGLVGRARDEGAADGADAPARRAS